MAWIAGSLAPPVGLLAANVEWLSPSQPAGAKETNVAASAALLISRSMKDLLGCRVKNGVLLRTALLAEQRTMCGQQWIDAIKPLLEHFGAAACEVTRCADVSGGARLAPWAD